MAEEIYELVLPAEVDRLPEVMSFVEGHLEEKETPMKTILQISMCCEEIFVNIASYAYGSEKGEARMRLVFVPGSLTITFTDSGKPFDPLAKPDPDVTLSAEERPIGGLGIYMTKNAMDHMSYEYKDNQNILTMTKNL